MDKMFTDFFSFAEDPFKRTPDVGFYFMSGRCRDALQTLNTLLQSDECFATLTAPPGAGKSITLHRFIQDLPDNVIFAYILFPSLRPEEFLQVLLENFDIPADAGTSQKPLRALFEKFIKLSVKSGKQIALIIDEAQKMPAETIEELFDLAECNPGLKFILAGRPELEKTLNMIQLRQPRHKTSLNALLDNLTPDENAEYIVHRAEQAGRTTALTSKSASRLAWNYTKGNPGLVNTLMERAIIAARMDGARVIRDEHIHAAAKSLNAVTGPVSTGKNKRRLVFSAAAALLAACFAFGGYKLYTVQPKPVVTASAVTTKPPAPSTGPTPPTEQSQIPAPPGGVIPPTAATPTPGISAPPAPVTQDITPEPPSAPEPAAAPTQPAPAEPTAPAPVIPTPAQPAEPRTPAQTPSGADFGIGSIAVVATPVLNVRSRPLLDSERIGTLYEGQRITIQEESRYWVRVTLNGGRDGWIYKQYLSKPENFIPSVPPAPLQTQPEQAP